MIDYSRYDYEVYTCIEGDIFDQIIYLHYTDNDDIDNLPIINGAVEFVLDWFKNQNLSRQPNFPIMNLGDVVYLPRLPDEFYRSAITETVKIFI